MTTGRINQGAVIFISAHSPLLHCYSVKTMRLDLNKALIIDLLFKKWFVLSNNTFCSNWAHHRVLVVIVISLLYDGGVVCAGGR